MTSQAYQTFEELPLTNVAAAIGILKAYSDAGDDEEISVSCAESPDLKPSRFVLIKIADVTAIFTAAQARALAEMFSRAEALGDAANVQMGDVAKMAAVIRTCADKVEEITH